MVIPIFKITISKLLELLPTVLRKDRALVILANACLFPLRTIHSNFIGYSNDIASIMGYNSQTCYLRKMLNDLYDPTQRRIQVRNAERNEYLMIYRMEEQLPVMINRDGDGAPTMIYRLDAINYDSRFDVLLPTSFLNNTQLVRQIEASINGYRLATRYFNIKMLPDV